MTVNSLAQTTDICAEEGCLHSFLAASFACRLSSIDFWDRPDYDPVLSHAVPAQVA